MLAENIIIITSINNMNVTANTETNNIEIIFRKSIKNPIIVLSAIGSIIADIKFNPKLKIIIFSNGDNIIETNINNTITPKLFFIKTQLVNIKSKPSAKYPPKIGIYVLVANFAALILTPSIVAAVNP